MVKKKKSVHLLYLLLLVCSCSPLLATAPRTQGNKGRTNNSSRNRILPIPENEERSHGGGLLVREEAPVRLHNPVVMRWNGGLSLFPSPLVSSLDRIIDNTHTPFTSGHNLNPRSRVPQSGKLKQKITFKFNTKTSPSGNRQKSPSYGYPEYLASKGREKRRKTTGVPVKTRRLVEMSTSTEENSDGSSSLRSGHDSKKDSLEEVVKSLQNQILALTVKNKTLKEEKQQIALRSSVVQRKQQIKINRLEKNNVVLKEQCKRLKEDNHLLRNQTKSKGSSSS